MKAREKALKTHGVGQAGVYAVASNLLLRGINVMFPAVDSGIDLVAEGGIRIQVKSSRLSVNKGMPVPAYHFNLSSWAAGADGKWKRRSRSWSEVVDYLVFWGIDENRFWIVPAMLIGKNVQHVQIASVTQVMRASREEVLNLKAAGFTGEQIAKQLGISPMTVSRLIRGLNSRCACALVHVRKCENRWDYLTDSTRLVNEIESVQSVATVQKENN